MGAVEYTNLRLSFKQRDGREYEVTASIDDGPTTTSTFTIPMSDEALQDAIRNLSETRSALAEPATRKVTPVTGKQVSAQEFGTTLADALITGEVATMFTEARSRGAVRVRLNMTNEPELLRIPWEFLRRNGMDLASHRDSTIVRELETAEPARPHHVEGKIRMLGVIANPRGDLDVAGEKSRVEEAIAKCSDRIELEWLENCTYKSLQRKLLEPYHILHFVGHGAFTDEGEAILLLSDETGQTKEARANAVAQLIGGQKALQLVVLNSCDGARTKLDDPFAGIATILVQQGNSAVIAMQFEITDNAAKAFAEELYYSLIDRRYPIDAAVAEARKAMMNINQIEFATPVLFLRPGTADLFHFADPPDPAVSTVVPPGPSGSVSSAGDVPPSPPGGAPSEVETPPSPRPNRRRWLIGVGGAVVAVIAVLGVVGALSSGGDDDQTTPTVPVTNAVDATVSVAQLADAPVPVTEPVEATVPVATPTTIGRDAYLYIQDCINSALFGEPYFDASASEPFYTGMGQCDEALNQLEADGLEADPLSVIIRERLVEADTLAASFEEGTDDPADHQAFAESGEGLYAEVDPMLRILRGLPPTPFFEDALSERVADEPLDGGSDPPEITGYTTLTDDTGVLTVDAPIEWEDVDTAPFTLDDGSESPMIMASPSIEEFQASYLTPGLFFTAFEPQDSLDDTLAEFAPGAGECTDAGIEDYDDSVYTGRWQTFTDCSDSGTVYVTVAAVPADNSFTAVVVMQLVSEADLAVLEKVVESFTVTL